MKKKLFSTLFLCFVSLTTLSANFDYQFDIFSLDPLHKEYFADRARADMSVNYLNYYSGYPTVLLQDTGDSVQVYDLGNSSTEGVMMQYKLGETFSIARNTFTFDSWLSPIAFDLSAQALIQSFYTESFNNGIGYDGIYFYGVTARIADMFSVRIGNHHYCSHYGDEIFKSLSSTDLTKINLGYKYIRMNGFVIGVSVEPTSWLRLYGEYNFIPEDVDTIRPIMFAPKYVNSNNSDYPDWYSAKIINVGIELNGTIFKNLGKTTIGYDLHMYEEGLIEYDIIDGSVVTFNEDGTWELEHNVKIAQDLNETVSIELSYHKGRSPFNNFYYLQTSYLSFGFRVNPKNTFTLINTDKS